MYGSSSRLWATPVRDGANRFVREKRMEGFTGSSEKVQ